MEKDIKYETLQPHQQVNHFQKSNHITTKAGLARTLKQSHWWTGVDSGDYFPQAFDLGSVGELDEFIEEFKFSQAVAGLYKYQ